MSIDNNQLAASQSQLGVVARSSSFEQAVDQNKPWKVSETWGEAQWREFFSKPNIAHGLLILTNFSTFAKANPTEAREIYDEAIEKYESVSRENSTNHPEKLAPSQRDLLRKIYEKHLNNFEPTVSNSSSTLHELHVVNEGQVSSAPPENPKEWKFPSWRDYFTAVDKSTDLSFAGENFHFFARGYPQAAENLLGSLRLGKFNEHGQKIIKALRKQVNQRTYNPVVISKENKRKSNGTTGTTDTAKGAKESNLNEDSRTASLANPVTKAVGIGNSTSEKPGLEITPEKLIVSDPLITFPRSSTPVGPAALDTSSWGKSDWEKYFKEIKPEDGVETLKTLRDFARVDFDSARELLEHPKYRRKVSRGQEAVMNSLYDKHVKPKLSDAKLTGAQVLNQVSKIDSTQTSNTVLAELNTPEVPKIPQTQEEWVSYFRKLDLMTPSEQFDQDMVAFKCFALEDPGAAMVAAAAAIPRQLYPVQIEKIREALNNPKAKTIPNQVRAPQKETTPVGLTTQALVSISKIASATKEHQGISPKASSNLQQPIKPAPATKDSGRRLPDEIEVRKLLPIGNFPKPQQPVKEDPPPVKKPKVEPKSAFGEELQSRVSKLSVDIYKATSQVFDIRAGSQFAKAKYAGIEQILSKTHQDLIKLTEALKALDGKALTHIDKSQLKSLSDDFFSLRGYTDNKDIQSSIDTFQTKVAALVGKTLMNQRAANAPEINDEPKILSLSSQPTPEPEKPKKESLELIHDLGVQINQAKQVKNNLTVNDKAHLTDWLTGNLGDLEKLAAEDSFLPLELNYKQAMPTLKYYAALLDLINKHDAVSLASKDSSDAQDLKSLIEGKVNNINKYLLTKIEKIDWGDETKLGDLFIQAFSIPYKLS